MAFSNYLPEAGHNEIVPFERTGENTIVLFLDDPESTKESIKKKMGVIKDVLNEYGVETLTLKINGKNIFEKIFSNLLLSHWVSLGLAKNYKVDPIKTKLIDEFKKRS